MFCECGTIIHFPTLASEPVKCLRCSAVIKDHRTATLLSTKVYAKKVDVEEIKVKGAKIKMKCPVCNAEEMSYNTAQLRSADEGQTVFYSCDECGYKDTVQS